MIWCCVQVSPPSCETATCSGAGAALPFSWPTNDAQQTYTVPKNGLDDALSAQICSLSENVVDDCRLISTGGIHAALPTRRRRGRDVVGARDGDRLEALERLLGARGAEVRVRLA